MTRLAVLLGCLRAAGCGPQSAPTPRDGGGTPALPEPGRRGTFTVGPDTTVVDGPLLPTGQIDYVAALNDQVRRSHRQRIDGPPVVLRILDADAVVARWRDGRSGS